ncbi:MULTISPECIES: ABC transporter permease [Devosia]|uniref:Autoinducer 2 import system permease protein LsrD n=1 Tax=Devosia equisanguinis TaxID=2490941 RepID=A0A3S4D3H9_9HYPH|nr:MULTISPECIES: ABC transporter permease [Devosia]ODT47860.1 MAG: ABC transporter permease [Pelagibacterium sp. SCN 63-126]ODU86676.1 MAG: ABC transporter permease [Pelagibacterium sp. SCN 63-17]OJX42429.1 MAG: ABC transporter permease [Devosia sp. 63-57]VDS03498.1 Ribose transport system permease protein RbsC [Devosia equisanguinis]
MTQDVLSQGAEPRRRLPQINPVYILVVVLILAIVVMNPAFGEPTGYMNYLKRVAALAILSGGALYVIISGGFDLSVGSTMTLTVIGSSMLASNDPNSTYWIIPLMLGIGVVIGVINGLVVSYLKVPSLIATLGMMISLNGVAFMWSGGAPRGYLPDTFRFFGRYNIADLPVISILPIAVICLVVFGAILWWGLHRTNFGRLLHAVGDNQQAARLAGVPVERIRISAFVVSSLTAVLAGVILGGRAGVSVNIGSGFELQAITAAVIGGAQLLGGRGSVPATIAGALALEAIFTLLNLLGLAQPVRLVVQGLILIGAVAFATYQRRRGGR